MGQQSPLVGSATLSATPLQGSPNKLAQGFENVVLALAYHFCMELAYKILPTLAQYFGVPCTLCSDRISKKVAHLNVIANQFLPQ